MTTSSEDTSSTIVSCQQTRFHIGEDSVSNEIDVKGLNIVISNDLRGTASDNGERKRKSNAGPEGLEILSSAHLKLKPGGHYALIGRNGTGKSTLLRALSEKLIPGIPFGLRIAILQQTEDHDSTLVNEVGPSQASVVSTVVKADRYRNAVVQELDMISKAFEENDGFAPVKALRQINHQRQQRRFFEIQKAAKQRSGARGFEARKALAAYEKKVEQSREILEEKESEVPLTAIESATAEAVKLQSDLQSELETMQLRDMESKAHQVLLGLGFKRSQLDQKFDTLSGGWKMRCLLAAALTQTTDLLILDEPTNFLDLQGILWLQRHLIELETSSPLTTLLLVSHDRDFMNAVCSETIIMKDRNLLYFSGNLAAYEKSVQHETFRMSRMKEAQDKQIAHMEKTIAGNIRQGKKAGDDGKLRQAKSRQKKLDDRMGMQVNAKGGRFKLNRDLAGYHHTSREALEAPKEERGVIIHFPQPPDLRFPGSLLSLENVSFSYPRAVKPTVQNANLVIHPGDRVGILGLNGAGKTTLIRLLLGDLKPTSGAVVHHPRLKVGCYSQNAVDILLAKTRSASSSTALSILRESAETLGSCITEVEARKLLGSLGLSGSLASDTPVSKLSGGQLARLAFARLFLEPPHVFVLDEPTTHLDSATVVALANALREYEGAVVLVTHDRYFMRCVVEGKAMEERGSDDEVDSSDVDDDNTGRRSILELKAGGLTLSEKGVGGWEARLESRLKKLTLI